MSNQTCQERDFCIKLESTNNTMKLVHYHEELQKAIDCCSKHLGKTKVAQMSETEIQWEYGRILAAERRKADKLEYVEMLNELDRYVTSQYKES